MDDESEAGSKMNKQIPVSALPVSAFLSLTNSVDALKTAPFMDRPGLNLFQGMDNQPVPSNSERSLQRLHEKLHQQGVQHDICSLLAAVLKNHREEVMSKSQRQMMDASKVRRNSENPGKEVSSGSDERLSLECQAGSATQAIAGPSATMTSISCHGTPGVSHTEVRSCAAQQLFTKNGKRNRDAAGPLPPNSQDESDGTSGEMAATDTPVPHHLSTPQHSEEEDEELMSEWGDEDEDDIIINRKDDQDPPPPDGGSGMAPPQPEQEPDGLGDGQDNGHGNGAQPSVNASEDNQNCAGMNHLPCLNSEVDTLLPEVVKYLRQQSDDHMEPIVIPFGKGIAAINFGQDGQIKEAVYIMCHSFWCPKEPIAPIGATIDEDNEESEHFKGYIAKEGPFVGPISPFLLAGKVAIKYKVQVKAILKSRPQQHGRKICRGETLTALVEQYGDKKNGDWIDDQPFAFLITKYAVLSRLINFLPFEWIQDSDGDWFFLPKEIAQEVTESQCLKTYGIGRLFALMEYLYRREDLKHRQGKIDNDSRWTQMPLTGRVPSWRPQETNIPSQFGFDEENKHTQKRHFYDKTASQAICYIKAVVEEEAQRRIQQRLIKASNLRKQNNNDEITVGYNIPVMTKAYSEEDPSGCFTSIAVFDEPDSPERPRGSNKGNKGKKRRPTSGMKAKTKTKKSVTFFCALEPHERPERIALQKLSEGVLVEELMKMLAKQNKDSWIKSLPKFVLSSKKRF